MLTIYKTDHGVCHKIPKAETGCWIDLCEPSSKELDEISLDFDIEPDDLRAALDEEEASRIVLEDDYTMILVDVPIVERRNDEDVYTTIPLGIILVADSVITVCMTQTSILADFQNNRVKQLDDTKVNDMIALHELESTLVYFETSLRGNEVVLNRLSLYKRIDQYPEDMELLDDVIIENKQAIEMATIYKDVISGTRELLSTIVDSRLNNMMKFLTSITLVMAIPTIVSGFYGMNVPLPKYSFGELTVLTIVVCIVSLIILKRKKML